MQANQEEITQGYRWFAFAGVFAVFLSVTLWYADEALSTSTAEYDHYKEMHELRRAQSRLATLSGERVGDHRLLAVPGPVTGHSAAASEQDETHAHSSDAGRHTDH
jgi:hypothetical protein